MGLQIMAFGLDDAVAAGLQVLNKFIPDPEAKIKAEADLRTALLQIDQTQAEVNVAEAQSGSLFISGWRPAIGWIGAGGLFYLYVFRPIAIGLGWSGLPGIDNGLYELVLSLLGFGGLRTFEKIKGVASK
jgi:Holin of 3TMs, for gene-transfer release